MKPARPPVVRADSEAGFSLIEVLLTVMIMGIAFVAILTAMATAAQSSALHRTQAVAELEVRRYAELVDSLPWRDDGQYTLPGSVSVPTPKAGLAPFTLAADGIACHAATTDNSSALCGGGETRQRVTVGIRSMDSKVHETVDIIKVKSVL